MIPEAAYAMLACARIGAVHSVVFGGFSPDSLADRIRDCGSKLVITADAGLRGGKMVPLKGKRRQRPEKMGDPAGQGADLSCIPATRYRGSRAATSSLNTLMAKASNECEPERMNAEDPLFILYTSGSTGKPKGVLHTTGGYLVYAAMTHEYVFDYHEGDVYWCTADVGWVTGHSYIVYGPLANGATTLMFEGIPTYPDVSRFWRDRRQAPRQHLLHRADGHPRADAVRRRAGRSTTCAACACSDRWASRSTRRPGFGIIESSATAAVRSWIPGGRRRPVAS